MTPFDVTIETTTTTATLRLSGELDTATAPALRDHVVRLISEGRSQLAFDCTNLEFIDSTGLGVLIGARARALAANGSVALQGVSPALRRLLVVTGIDGLFPEPATT
ncbi:MAG TPA: STAS domain-containing protein [Acidimicrobiales bacterium]|nr:STAS domain-containing protein [Acidimicrobiales bacterium]